MPRLLPRRWLWRGVLAAVLVLVGVGVAALVIVLSKPGNVSHPNLQFTQPKKAATTRRAKRSQVTNFLWPWYGYDGGRTRDFVAPADLKPPLHRGWIYEGNQLLEFPPSIDKHTLYFLDDGGTAHAIDSRTGKRIWGRRIGTLAAATPALAPKDGVALMPVLSEHGHRPGGGRFVALSMATGRVRWSRPLGPGSESSPIVSGNTVYYGDNGGSVYARDIRTGHLEWRFHAKAAVKGGPALVGGTLYFGDYAGRAYAIRASTGHQIWSTSTSGAHFGLGSGSFYATPAVAYGRVYMGNTDGRMYSFGARTGALAWAHATGGYIYASAATADIPKIGPTVFAGSYDGRMYAFDARSGRIRWSHYAGGRISGAATVIGNLVYFSDLGTHRTAGLDVHSGRELFSWGDGAFTPVVADTHAIYLVGYAHIYQMLPGRRLANGRVIVPSRHRRGHRRPHRRAVHHASRHPARHAARHTASPRRRTPRRNR